MLPRCTEEPVEIVTRLAWPEVAWGTPLVQALVAGTLPAGVAPPSSNEFPAGTSRPDTDPAFLTALEHEMPAPRTAAWAPLHTPGARVVVTGQQPGCAGGALLVLYKAATAVALARRTAAVLGHPVVPVFWNGTDDEDFEEVARVGWPAGARGLDYLELPRDSRRAGGWVGDLPAAGDLAAGAHVLSTLDLRQRASLAAFLPASARDHGDWVGALLAAVFPELAILDARSAVLRRYAAPLFARYLAARAAAPGALRGAGEALRQAGFAPVLAPESAARALYLTPERQRQKLGDDARPLEQAVAESPEHVSPSVVLRPLVQDAVLPVIAHVVGPSEVGYLLELRGLRELLEVPEPALVVRASCTLIEAGGWAAARSRGIDPGALVRDPERALQDSSQARPELEALAGAFAALTGAVTELPLAASVRERAARRVAAIHDDLRGELEAGARAALLAAEPELGALPGLLRPRGRAQERLLAGLWALAHWGEVAPAALLHLAGSHLDALAARRGEHLVVTL